jgi:hypothetical protein
MCLQQAWNKSVSTHYIGIILTTMLILDSAGLQMTLLNIGPKFALDAA